MSLNPVRSPGVTETNGQGNNLNSKVASLRVMNTNQLTGAQRTELEHRFRQHMVKVQTSVGGYLVNDTALADGSRVRIISNSGMHQVMVWPVGNQKTVTVPAIFMDNGIVRLDDADLYGAGLLWWTDPVETYNAAFTKAVKGGLFFSNPTGENDDQLSGMVGIFAGPSFRGQVPPDGHQARSFKPLLIPDPLNPGEMIPDPEDGGLMVKSQMARDVPPSVFTGRARLYAQAMYGAWRRASGGPALPQAVTGNYRPPYLNLPHYRGGGDETDYPSMLPLNTNSGVFLDSLTGRHWLIAPPNMSDTVSFYPLVSDPIGEGLRKYLRADSTAGLSTEGKRKLEAYLLSTARPDRANVQHVEVPAFGEALSLNYGWHFNWSGTEATIVVNTLFSQGMTAGGEAFAYSSVVWTLAISVEHDEDEVATFDATLTEGAASEWTAPRSVVCIAEPGFLTGNQFKVLPEVTTPFEFGGVPFYAFYEQDSLKICRITASFNPGVAGGFNGSEWAYGTTFFEVPTIGSDSGFGERTSGIPEHWSYTIEVDGTDYGPVTTNYAEATTFFGVQKSGGVEPSNIPFNIPGTARFRRGYPIGFFPTTWDTVEITGNIGYPNVPWTYVLELTEREETVTHTGYLVCFTPRFDAEAFCVVAKQEKLTVIDETKRTLEPYPGWTYDNQHQPSFTGWSRPPGARVTHHNFGPQTLPGAVVASEIETDEETLEVLLDDSALHAGKDQSAATVDASLFFADSDEEVTANTSCRSGTLQGVVEAEALGATSGIGDTTNEAGTAVLVGWT